MNICYDFLRLRKAALLKERYRLYAEYPEATIRREQDALVLPAYIDARGDLVAGVIDSLGCFVEESHEVDFPQEIEVRFADARKVEVRDETAVYLGYFNPHWGHFITDCLSTFWFLGQIRADRYVFSCMEGANPVIHPNIREALELLGVWEKTEFIAVPVSYRELYIPKKGMLPREYILEECREVYERIRDAACEGMTEASGSERLLLCRGRLPKALLNDLGTGEVENFLIVNGYTPLYPEQLTLTELIRRLANAREVAAISGTLPHNMLFAPQGSRLTVIEKYSSINNYQQGIDRLKDLNATYVDANFQIWPVDPGTGPFILTATEELRRYANKYGFTGVERCELSPRRTLRSFFSLFKRHYGRRFIMPSWLECEIGLMTEAYEATYAAYAPWLDGRRPVFFSDALSPRFIYKTLRRWLTASRKR